MVVRMGQHLRQIPQAFLNAFVQVINPMLGNTILIQSHYHLKVAVNPRKKWKYKIGGSRVTSKRSISVLGDIHIMLPFY